MIWRVNLMGNNLCKPPDIKSFITSYLSATLWNTCSTHVSSRGPFGGMEAASVPAAPHLRHQALLQLVRDGLKPEMCCGIGAWGGEAKECLLGATVIAVDAAATAAALSRTGQAPDCYGGCSTRTHGEPIHLERTVASPDLTSAVQFNSAAEAAARLMTGGGLRTMEGDNDRRPAN